MPMSDLSPLQEELKHLGLSEKESDVYLASLELGPSSVQDISHKSKVNRATTYVMIESLSARGLMSTFTKGKKKFYSAESPERLVSIIDHEKNALDEKLRELHKVMPMLNAMYNAEGIKPQVRYLEGIEGVETVRQIAERLTGDFVEIFPLEDVLQTKELLGPGREAHHAKLKKIGVGHRVIAITNEKNPTCLPDMGGGQWKMIPPEDFPIHGSISVRQDHVFLFSYKSGIISAVIHSKEIAQTVRALFDLAWKGAGSYPGKNC
jgi:HTH-type transcriptional regulator, sugar sensing transcriptional regulator